MRWLFCWLLIGGEKSADLAQRFNHLVILGVTIRVAVAEAEEGVHACFPRGVAFHNVVTVVMEMQRESVAMSIMRHRILFRVAGPSSVVTEITSVLPTRSLRPWVRPSIAQPMPAWSS